MSQILAPATKFTATARARITDYVTRRNFDVAEIHALTPDASTREYFRIPYHDNLTAIAAVYSESFDPKTLPFLDVTRLFVEARLPVPEILDVNATCGIVIQEDFGDTQLRAILEQSDETTRAIFLREAIELIAQIQAATALACSRDSIASRLAFDTEKLLWELDFFYAHYFGSYRHETLPPETEAALREELRAIATELAARPRVLCHRDFHTSNLMIDENERVRIIDYQDARMGPVTYDLVSLLLDRQSAPPSVAGLREWQKFLLAARMKRGLPAIDADDFANEFDLMTVQRQLKALGTFSFQTGVVGRGEFYGKFIAPTSETVRQTAERMNKFPILREMLVNKER